MKNRILTLMSAVLITSCTFKTETAQNASEAADAYIANLLKRNYDAIYEDGSIEMRSNVSKEVFLMVTALQENINGKIVDAELLNESSGEYRLDNTRIYQYKLKNDKGENVTLTAEFLKGHLLKSHMEAPSWANEPDFANKLVTPIAGLIKERNAKKIHELLDGRYTFEQVQPVLEQIATSCEGVPHKYERSWTEDDENGKMIVGFVYAYQGKGSLEYRFYVKEDYPFEGMFFTPDESTKLPD